MYCTFNQSSHFACEISHRMYSSVIIITDLYHNLHEDKEIKQNSDIPEINQSDRMNVLLEEKNI